MKPTFLKNVAPLGVAIAMLSACGGGGDESGSPTEFSTVPTEFTLKAGPGAPAGTCPETTTTVDVFVYGGTAPYRIDNTVSSWINVDRTVVQHKGGKFTVSFRGGCLSPGQVVVVDKLDRQVTVEINYEPADEN